MLINIIGSGNVATHLGRALLLADHQILTVASRNINNARPLACELGASCTTNIAALPTSDATIIAVSDNSIATVATQLPPSQNTVILHTSGATNINALKNHPHHAVLYPCQSFTKNDALSLNNCPFFIEANNDFSLKIAQQLAASISSTPATICTSLQRTYLHAAAVFASNFTNHLLLQAQQIMSDANLPFEALKPLVAQTINKAFALGPLDAQTGPARRNDSQTINRHLSLLSDDKKNLYKVLSLSISNLYNNTNNNNNI